MKKQMLKMLVAAAASLAVLMPLTAQEKDSANKQEKSGSEKVKVQSVYRVSTIAGMPVKNNAGEDLGKIEDLVVELNSGEVRYAALSFGGFASVGDKLFAIPWQALAFKFGEDESYFILDVTEEKLARAPGFEEDKWPDLADPSQSGKIDAFYGIKREEGAKRKDRGSDDEAKRPKDAAKPGELVYDAVYRVENITGMDVKNDRGEDLGSIHELVVDIKQGNVRYAALSFGGVLGLGDKLFAIPWKSLGFKHQATDKHFVLNVSPEKLKQAEGFDEDRWPDTGDPKWSQAIDDLYRTDSDERSATRPKRTEKD